MKALDAEVHAKAEENQTLTAQARELQQDLTSWDNSNAEVRSDLSRTQVKIRMANEPLKF
jgi:hypothetical protein